MALLARDRDAFPLRFQALIYPITDLTLSAPSVRVMPHEPVLSSADLTSYVEAYLGPGGDPRILVCLRCWLATTVGSRRH